MASSASLQVKIKKLESAIRSKSTPKSFIPKLESQLRQAKTELGTKTKLVKGGGGRQSANQLVKNSQVRRKKQGLSTSSNDIHKDAGRPALPAGRRVSASGNVYFENRENRIDKRQPPRKYPKLEDGGMMAKGGDIGEENTDMLHNQVQNIKHHAMELSELVHKGMEVEPWVITKAQRAATDLADITHYLDGEKESFAKGGAVSGKFMHVGNNVHRMDK